MHPKKSLGQNFLTNTRVIDTMIEAARISPEDTVLEIGPGRGVLTEKLLTHAGHVIAVEKDDRMIPYLSERFSKHIQSGTLTLLHGDILEMDLQDIPLTKYKLAANIPYYITGKILRHVLGAENQPQVAVLLVQKEVAERVTARDMKESILSMSVKVYGEPRYIRTVRRGNFVPAPQVDSAVLLIENISRDNFQNNFKNASEERFFRIIKTGFAHKRKRVLANLAPLAQQEPLNTAGIPENARAEDLSLEDWLRITGKEN